MPKNNYINILLISGTGILAGLLNYIYHPIMIKFLSIEKFGEFGSLIGIFNIIGVITTGLILFLNKEISKNIGNNSKIKFIFLESTKIFLVLGILIFLVYLLFIPLISSFLDIKEYLVIAFVGMGIISSFLVVPLESFLRGFKKFEILSIYTLIGPIIKLILGGVLVYLGFSIYGAVLGFVLASIGSILFGYFYFFKTFSSVKSSGSTKELLNDFIKNKKEIFSFFLTSLFFAVLMNIDVILVKNIFPSEIAGIYAGLSVLGKFLIFLLLSIETVYFGQIMEYDKKKLPKHLITNPLVLITIAGIGAIVVNLFLGSFFLSILKPEFVLYKDLYILILIYYFFVAFISFFAKVLTGWGNRLINYIIGILCLVLISVVYIFGNTSLENFIYSFIGVGILGSLILGGYFYFNYNKTK